MENEFNEIDPKRGDLVIISTFLHPPRLGGAGPKAREWRRPRVKDGANQFAW